MFEVVAKHPWIIPVAHYVLSALVSCLVKPRTPEEYAAMPPRLAAFLKAYVAIGLDIPKLFEGSVQVATGKRREDK